ncbi:uncharacterized protein LOC134178922 [Corticium candelabrum]|uniref:uncharacterized protein LOC134178922 n=1 Tax=Corticium candelabrum TaxID=121492 RepID=UPI002E25407E|nr:uncharacterized protein LOC134178922 [Corticium candelabrum]
MSENHLNKRTKCTSVQVQKKPIAQNSVEIDVRTPIVRDNRLRQSHTRSDRANVENDTKLDTTINQSFQFSDMTMEDVCFELTVEFVKFMSEWDVQEDDVVENVMTALLTSVNMHQHATILELEQRLYVSFKKINAFLRTLFFLCKTAPTTLRKEAPKLNRRSRCDSK